MKTIIIILTVGFSFQVKAEQNGVFNQVFKDWTRPHYSGVEAMPQGASMDAIYKARIEAAQPKQNNTYIIQQQPQQNGFGNFGTFGNDEE